jgi:hypothetical protein
MLRGAPVRIAAVAACLGVGLWHWPRGDDRPAPAELAQAALSAPTLSEQTAAAAQLADYGDAALDALRQVVAATTQPAVKAVCVEGLAKLWDYQSMDLFLELAEHGPPQVRGRAAQVFMRMTGRQRPYFAGASPAERQILIRHMRADWEEIQKATAEDRDELKRRLRESHEQKR